MTADTDGATARLQLRIRRRRCCCPRRPLAWTEAVPAVRGTPAVEAVDIVLGALFTRQ